VRYVRFGSSDNTFGLLNRIPRAFWRLVDWDPVDLCGIEHVRQKDVRAFQWNNFNTWNSLLVEDRRTVGSLCFATDLEFPVLDLSGFFALTNLIAFVLGLFCTSSSADRSMVFPSKGLD
jgi:hypothetical protein